MCCNLSGAVRPKTGLRAARCYYMRNLRQMQALFSRGTKSRWLASAVSGNSCTRRSHGLTTARSRRNGGSKPTPYQPTGLSFTTALPLRCSALQTSTVILCRDVRKNHRSYSMVLKLLQAITVFRTPEDGCPVRWCIQWVVGDAPIPRRSAYSNPLAERTPQLFTFHYSLAARRGARSCAMAWCDICGGLKAARPTGVIR